MTMTNYNIHDIVYILWASDVFIVTEISIQPTKKEYKLWKKWSNEYSWYDDWQITKEEPSKIWFKTN